MSEDRKEDQPRPFKGEFSFVNKDAGNIDSKDHNSAVSWHVLNRYEKWKRQEQAKKLRASANIPVGSIPTTPQSQDQRSSSSRVITPPPSSSRRGSSNESSKRRRLSDKPRSQSRSNPSTPFGFEPWMANQPMQLGYGNVDPSAESSSGIPTSTTSSPMTYYAQDETDPLGIFPDLPADTSIDVPMDTGFNLANPLTESLVSFGREFLIPQTWPNETGKIIGQYEMNRALDDLSGVYEDAAHANAYLSYLSGCLADTSEDDALTKQSQLFRSRAMAELSRRVKRPGDKSLHTLKAVLKLFCSETIVDNTSVARTHIKMLRNLVNEQGGVLLLDSWFREDLLSCDTYFALKYETRPLFPAQEWTPGPLGQPWKVRLAAAGIQDHHSPGINPLIEHPVVKSVMADLREVIRTQDYIISHDIQPDDQLLRWNQVRKLDCVSRIADHYVNMIIYPHLYSVPQTQAYTSTAIALFVHLVLGSPEPVRFGLQLLERLKKKLTESEDEEEANDFQQLRFWALYVGSLAEKVHPVATESARWFERRFQALGPEVQATSWPDVRDLLSSFLYSDTLHQEINNGRAYRTFDFRKGVYSISGCSWREALQDDDPQENVSAGKRRASSR